MNTNIKNNPSKGMVLKVEEILFTQRPFFYDNNQKQLYRYLKSLYEKYKRTTSLHQPASKTYGAMQKAYNKAQLLLDTHNNTKQ